jgi:MFS family permease
MIKAGNLKKFGIYNMVLLFFFLSDGIFEISLPIYLISLGHSFGEIGVMVAAFSIGIVVFRLFVSIHSDKVGRKIYVITSLAGSAVTCFLLPLGNAILFFMIILIARGACRGAFLAVRAPIIKDICNENERGKMLGLASAFSTIGSALGGVLSGWLYFEDDIWVLFFVIGFIYLLAAFISFALLPQNKNSERPHVILKNTNSTNGFWTKFKKVPNTIRFLCGVNIVQNIVTPPLWSMILPVYFTSVIGMSMKAMGLVFTMDNVLGVPSSLVGGIWADKKRYKSKSIIFSLICAFIIMILSAQKNPIIFTILILVFMTVFSINSPILEKIESVSARETEAGFDLGLISASVALGSAIGSLLFGFIIDTYGFVIAYISVGAGYVLIALLLSNIRTNDGRDNNKLGC